MGGGDVPLYKVIRVAQELTWVNHGKKVFPKIFAGADGLSPENFTAAVLMGFLTSAKPLPETERPPLSGLRPTFGASDLVRTQ